MKRKQEDRSLDQSLGGLLGEEPTSSLVFCRRGSGEAQVSALSLLLQYCVYADRTFNCMNV